MRTFDQCLPTIYWHVLRRFPGADCYISTIFDENQAKANLLAEKFPTFATKIAIAPIQPDCVSEIRAQGAFLPAERMTGARYMFEPYAISVSPQNVLRQLWQLEQGWNLAAASGKEYDIFVRIRPDLFFHGLELPDLEGASDRLALLPWWGQFGGVNDRFAILGRAAAQYYFTTYSRTSGLLKMGCPLHPETLVLSSLEYICRREDMRKIPAEFSTLRDKNQMRGPEISPFDMANAGMR